VSTHALDRQIKSMKTQNSQAPAVRFASSSRDFRRDGGCYDLRAAPERCPEYGQSARLLICRETNSVKPFSVNIDHKVMAERNLFCAERFAAIEHVPDPPIGVVPRFGS
jgi:hypothetical protein